MACSMQIRWEDCWWRSCSQRAIPCSVQAITKISVLPIAALMGRRDPHVHAAGTARPRLQAHPVLTALRFTLIGNRARVTMHQDVPAITERLVTGGRLRS
jgi:hypothetical protein